MDGILNAVHRLRKVVVLLAQKKWDQDDCRRERRLHDEEWRRTGLSKNLLDGLVIRMIRCQLDGTLGSRTADSVIEDVIADFRAVKVGEGRSISGRFHIRTADPADPYLAYGFAEALHKRLDRFMAYADVPFPGKPMTVQH